MRPTGIASVSILADGFVAHREADEDIAVQSTNADDWQRLREAMTGQNRLTVRVPRSAALPVILPSLPGSRRELARMLAGKVPVRAGELATTQPRELAEGGAEVIVVRQAWLDPYVEEIERELAIVPRVIVEPDGARLLYRSPRARRRAATTALIVGASLIIGVAALAMPGRGAAVPPPAVAQPAQSQPAGISSTLMGLAIAVPAGAKLAEIARDSGGAVSVQVDSVDPEGLRSALAAADASSPWREASQARQGSVGYRTRFIRLGSAATEPSRPAAALVAPSRREAVEIVARSLQAKARARVLALELSAAPGAGDPLDFAVRIAGPQAAVLSLADDIESGLPAARFAEWRLQPEGDGVRLTGTLIVPWRRGP